MKDADLHTAAGQTVGPLPYHGMRDYPDRPQRFPATPEDVLYLDRYQTRDVDDRAFRERLSGPRPTESAVDRD